mgnify:CR=1 FL=1
MNMNPNISVVVPLFNEAESLPELYAWIKRVMDTNKFTYEIIFVNDGSTDSSGILCDQLAQQDSRMQVVHKENGGLKLWHFFRAQ